MPTIAATSAQDAATYSHSLDGLISVAVAGLVLVTAGYLVRCWLFPFTACRHNPRRAWRCHRCQGTGLRLRTGRRLINHFRAMRRH